MLVLIDPPARVAWDKGKALSYLLNELGLERKYGIGEGDVLSLYFGDDHTDEAGPRGPGLPR